MKDIEKIIYETTRELNNVEDKLRIATPFLFTYKHSSKLFSELLYCDNHIELIEKLNKHYLSYEVDFTIKLEDKNIRNSFDKTLVKVIQKYDDNGYYKALFEKDEFALVIDEITRYEFDSLKFSRRVSELNKQLKLF